MRIAIYPGSFDPLTNGHVDIALRAKTLFDKIIILVADNGAKKGNYLFSTQERVDMAKKVFSKYEGFEVESFSGMVVKYAHDRDIKAIIRGLRAVTDYEMEYQLHEINHYLQPEVEMVYLMANKKEAFISSSAVKEIYSLHGDISPMVPEEVLEAMKKKLD